MKDPLARFTPSLMSQEALESIFVGRERVASMLVERIRESALTPARHHPLLIGPRGIGKTHLLSLVYHRIRQMQDLEDALLIAWLREEEWGMTSFLDFLLSVLQALEEEYPALGLGPTLEKLRAAPSREMEAQAEALLTKTLHGRVLLIMMENLDEIFKGLGDKGQKGLRAFIQNERNVCCVATSQSLFGGVTLRESPFHGFFALHHLPQFSLPEGIELLQKVAIWNQDADLQRFLQTVRGRTRVRALHHLAGGNPRVYIIFAQFLNRKALDELVAPLLQTLDDLTPYYQSRISWLPPKQRKIVRFLLEQRGAVTVKVIATGCRMTQQSTSGQLRSLRQKGYVESHSQGRESYYEIREPLMRLAAEVKKQRGKPVRLLLEFLRLWYSARELDARLAEISETYPLEREYLSTVAEPAAGGAYDLASVCEEDYQRYLKRGEKQKAMLAAEELVQLRGHLPWLVKFREAYEQGKADEAIRICDEVVERFGERAEAALAEQVAGALLNKGVALGSQGRPDEEIAVYDEVVERFGERPEAGLAEQVAKALVNKGGVLGSQGRADEAMEVCEAIVQRAGERSRAEVPDFLKPALMHLVLLLPAEAVSQAKWEGLFQRLEEVLGRQAGFEVLLRVLRAGVRFRESRDERHLLELPAEERKVLREIFPKKDET